MDKKDVLILEELQKNAQKTVSQLAKELKMPITTVHSRLKKLRRDGTIGSVRAILDPEKTGMEVLSFILVSFDYKSPDVTQREVAKRISQLHMVQEVHLISGEWDMLVKVRGPSNSKISTFVLDKLRMIPGVSKSNTMFIMGTVKESTEIDLSMRDRKAIK